MIVKAVLKPTLSFECSRKEKQLKRKKPFKMISGCEACVSSGQLGSFDSVLEKSIIRIVY